MKILAMLVLAIAACGNAVADAPSVEDQLTAKRNAMLDELHAYWVRGEFPVNVYRDEMANIFRDGDGRLCAVANLIHASGHDELVDAQVKQDNFIALRDLDRGPVMDWIAQSGFTYEELVDLQGLGYQPIDMNDIKLEVVQPDTRIALERLQLQTRLSAAEQKMRANTKRSVTIAAARATLRR